MSLFKRWAIFVLLPGLLVGLTQMPNAWSGEQEAYQHLGERMDVYFSDAQPRLIESYMTPYPPGPDGTVERVTFLYDSALAVIAFVDRGTPEDLERAKQLCDALVWYQQHDPVGEGRLRQAYYADQDLTTATYPQLATGFGHSHTGDLAWAGLALLSYFERVRDPQIADPFQDPNAEYLQAAVDLANFLVNQLRDSEQPGWHLGFRESFVDMTAGLPLSAYAQLTPEIQEIAIPLADFAAQGLNLQRLRTISLLFNAPQSPTGTITFQDIQFVNNQTGQTLLVDDFSDTDRFHNALGFLVGGTADFSADPTGRVITWNSADGTNDFWFSRLVADPNQLPRLDAAGYTHLVLTLSGSVGGEDFTVELKGYPLAQYLVSAKSTEHNLDVYALCWRLADLTGMSSWTGYAQEAKQFVEQTAWDVLEGKFWAGTLSDNGGVNTVNLTLDQQAWALLALGRVGRYGPALAWAESVLGVASDGFTGFDYGVNVNPSDPWYTPMPDGVWFEGTAQMAGAYQVSGTSGGVDASAFYQAQLDQAQQTALNANGKSLVAASHDGLTTGFPFFSYFASGHIGATAWYLAATRHLNMFWTTATNEPVPHDNQPPVLEPIGNRTVLVGQTLVIQLAASDPDGDELVYTVSGLPRGAVFDPETSTLIWTPTPWQIGLHQVTVTVSDPYGAVDSETFQILVTTLFKQFPRRGPSWLSTKADK